MMTFFVSVWAVRTKCLPSGRRLYVMPDASVDDPGMLGMMEKGGRKTSFDRAILDAQGSPVQDSGTYTVQTNFAFPSPDLRQNGLHGWPRLSQRSGPVLPYAIHCQINSSESFHLGFGH